MLQFHGDKSDVWLRAAMWEFNERDNSERAKDLFLRGLQRHPSCTKLTEQFFKCILLETSKLDTEYNLEDDSESAQTLGMKRVDLIYENSKKYIKDVKFLENLLIICEDFPFTKDLQKRIIEDMTENYQKNEEVWDVLARRELRGFHMVDLESDADSFNKRTAEKRIEMCCMVYQNGVKNVSYIFFTYLNVLQSCDENSVQHSSLNFTEILFYYLSHKRKWGIWPLEGSYDPFK